jgi:hypothetical protein
MLPTFVSQSPSPAEEINSWVKQYLVQLTKSSENSIRIQVLCKVIPCHLVNGSHDVNDFSAWRWRNYNPWKCWESPPYNTAWNRKSSATWLWDSQTSKIPVCSLTWRSTYFSSILHIWCSSYFSSILSTSWSKYFNSILYIWLSGYSSSILHTFQSISEYTQNSEELVIMKVICQWNAVSSCEKPCPDGFCVHCVRGSCFTRCCSHKCYSHTLYLYSTSPVPFAGQPSSSHHSTHCLTQTVWNVWDFIPVFLVTTVGYVTCTNVLFNDTVKLLPLYSTDDRWMNEYGALVEWQWQGQTKVLGENPVPVPRCLPQISRGLTWDWTRPPQ